MSSGTDNPAIPIYPANPADQCVDSPSRVVMCGRTQILLSARWYHSGIVTIIMGVTRVWDGSFGSPFFRATSVSSRPTLGHTEPPNALWQPSAHFMNTTGGASPLPRPTPLRTVGRSGPWTQHACSRRGRGMQDHPDIIIQSEDA
jgi:hypothetical protein